MLELSLFLISTSNGAVMLVELYKNTLTEMSEQLESMLPCHVLSSSASLRELEGDAGVCSVCSVCGASEVGTGMYLGADRKSLLMLEGP
jgi:hypothetical protein